jgi:hypothetical protein
MGWRRDLGLGGFLFYFFTSFSMPQRRQYQKLEGPIPKARRQHQKHGAKAKFTGARLIFL